MFLKTLSFIFCALTVLCADAEDDTPAASNKLSVKHDRKTGVTIINVPCRVSSHLHNIYRGRFSLNANNFKEARLIAARLDHRNSSYKFPCTGSGLYYYAVSSCTPMGTDEQFEQGSSAMNEIDRTPPSAPEVKFSYCDGKVVMEWNSPSLRNPENIDRFHIYRSTALNSKPVRIGVLKKVRAHTQSFRDETWNADKAFYHVTAVDAAGNESVDFVRFAANRKPNLSLSGHERIALNPALSTTKMYPKVGETVKMTALIRNTGAVVSSPCRVVVSSSGKILLETPFAALEPAAARTVEWSYTPKNSGEYSMMVSIDPDNRSGDGDPSDNRLNIKAAAVKRDVYSIWYGDVVQLPFSNSGQCLAYRIGEWHRRGALAMCGTGAGSNGLENYLAIGKQPYDGFSIDEIYMFTENAQYVAKQLPVYRSKSPKQLVALWTIGEDAAPEIVALVKNGTIDLLMFEVYVKPGESLEPLHKAIANIRKHGILEKSLIGLVTDRSWSNWVSPEEQTKSVIAQMRLVRKLAPEMPGLAFWSADTQPGVAETVDAEFYKLFVLDIVK